MSHSRERLHGVSGRGFALATVLGGTIGIGILRMPGEVAASVPSYPFILCLWILGGVYALFGAFCFGELAGMVPHAGGPYSYLREAFGPRLAFAVGWADWLSFCSVLALLLIATAEYGAQLFPAFSPHIKLVALAVVLLFFAANWFGMRVSSKVQELTSAAKVLGLVLLVVAAFAFGKESGPWSAVQFNWPQLHTAGWLKGSEVVLSAYAGWHAAVYFAEEGRDRRGNISKALVTGVVMVTGIYVLINAAILHILPVWQLSQSILPAADSMQAVFGGHTGQAIIGICLLCLLSILNVYLLSSSRILFALGRDHGWSFVSAVNAAGAPNRAMLWSLATTVALLVTGSFATLVGAASFIVLIVYTVCFAAQIRLRKLQPWRERPFKGAGYPWTTILAIAISAGLFIGMIFDDYRSSLYSLGFLLASYAAYKTSGKLAGGLLPQAMRVKHPSTFTIWPRPTGPIGSSENISDPCI